MHSTRIERKAFGPNVILILVSLVIVLPIIAIVSVSFSREADIYDSGFALLPAHFSLSSYGYILSASAEIARSYLLTVFVTALGTFISISLTVAFAYPLTIPSFKYRGVLNRLLVVTLLFNGGMIPTYIVVTQLLHFGNTIWGHIMPFAIFPFYVILMRTFFQSLPGEVRESALIDGASELTILLRIVLPLSKPAIAAVVLLTSLRIWNDTWYTGMLYMTGNGLRTLPMYLQQMMNNIKVMTEMAARLGRELGDLPKETARMAMCVITIGPILVALPFFQKYFVKGITLGAVKG
jgi:putative aldouronate transport system permease protein